jgi:serine/threonine protein phosphatase PrpC
MMEAVWQNKETGSSTCVIATLNKHKPILTTCNLGDSGYLLLRKSGLDLVQIFKSKE